jgi:hypothetical protein
MLKIKILGHIYNSCDSKTILWRNIGVLWAGLSLLPASACFLLDLFFDPEDGGEMFLQNIGWLSMDYTALYPKR